MYITILTPPMVNNKKIETVSAHLIEHIVGMSEKNTEQDYFTKFIDSRRETFNSYTKLHFPDEIGKEQILKIVFQKLSEDVYIKEKKTLQEELKEIKYSYAQGLLIRVSKKLYGNGYIGDYGKMPDFSRIQTYWNEYYHESNIIISNDNDKIISIGKNISLAASIGEDTISVHSISKDESTIKCLCFSHSTSKNHRLAYFIHQLLDNYLRYVKRYKEHKYYYGTTDYFKTWKHFILTFNNNDFLLPPESFFNYFKAYFLKNCFIQYDKYWKIMDMIHGIKPMSDSQYKKRIKEISYDSIINILKKV